VPGHHGGRDQSTSGDAGLRFEGSGPKIRGKDDNRRGDEVSSIQHKDESCEDGGDAVATASQVSSCESRASDADIPAVARAMQTAVSLAVRQDARRGEARRGQIVTTEKRQARASVDVGAAIGSRYASVPFLGVSAFQGSGQERTKREEPTWRDRFTLIYVAPRRVYRRPR
jgi:hypothetical protein